MPFKKLLFIGAALTFAACTVETSSDVPAAPTETKVVETVTDATEGMSAAVSLDDILASQPDNVRARYDARNPKETLEFFNIQPGMTVAEVLPGGGWYSKIIMPYLGEDGHFVGIDYDVDMWSKFGGFANPEFLEKRKSWADTWSLDASSWEMDSKPKISAFALGSVPSELEGSVDIVLMFRALHHLNRFERAYWDASLNDVKKILKPGGMVGIVQHRGPESNPDDWAVGDNGYMKQSFVISAFEDAGFELVGEPSEINANPKDQPTAEDMVWRLPPTLGTSREDPELKAKMEAIGETDRMTLLFKLK